MLDSNVPKKTAFTEEKEIRATKGLKIKNKPKELTTEEVQQNLANRIERTAEQTIHDRRQRDENGAAILRQYVALLKSKQLVQNKGEIGKQAEREVVSQILDLAISINNDVNEDKDGMGTIPVLNLILKCALLQRDRINELEYKIFHMDKEIKELKKK